MVSNPTPMKTLFFLGCLAATVLWAGDQAKAIDLGTVAAETPYESYMQPVKETLSLLSERPATMRRVKQLMKASYGFRYSFTEPYVAARPEVTTRTKTGDCKAKSLWLVDQLGDRNVRFVIGKARQDSEISHAWVLWNDGARWWVLDPTNTPNPIAASGVPSGQYIPLYSYGPFASYRHPAAPPPTVNRSVVSVPLIAVNGPN